jgi:hypothetical protein
MASGSYVPHQQAEHMTAPTRPRTTSMKPLANGEPFSNRASVVNDLLRLRCCPGVTVLSAVG